MICSQLIFLDVDYQIFELTSTYFIFFIFVCVYGGVFIYSKISTLDQMTHFQLISFNVDYQILELKKCLYLLLVFVFEIFFLMLWVRLDLINVIPNKPIGNKCWLLSPSISINIIWNELMPINNSLSPQVQHLSFIKCRSSHF
jgi:hypothetical protein